MHCDHSRINKIKDIITNMYKSCIDATEPVQLFNQQNKALHIKFISNERYIKISVTTEHNSDSS